MYTVDMSETVFRTVKREANAIGPAFARLQNSLAFRLQKAMDAKLREFFHPTVVAQIIITLEIAPMETWELSDEAIEALAASTASVLDTVYRLYRDAKMADPAAWTVHFAKGMNISEYFIG